MDITDLILDQHEEQRRLFGFIYELRGNNEALGPIWQRLRGLLDAHAEAEERFFYPRLLRSGTGAADAKDAVDETCDAIKDHNEIRHSAEAVQKFPLGSRDWFDAVTRADVANSKHMSEEERQALADYRQHVPLQERHEAGARFLGFVSQHLLGIRPVDKDPTAYVRQHGREPEKV
jgi:hypothetical protein